MIEIEKTLFIPEGKFSFFFSSVSVFKFIKTYRMISCMYVLDHNVINIERNMKNQTYETLLKQHVILNE